jgi:hypothetical protein
MLSFLWSAVCAFTLRSGPYLGVLTRRCRSQRYNKAIAKLRPTSPASRKLVPSSYLLSQITQDSSHHSPIAGAESPRIRLFDSMAGAKRDFKPLVPGKVKMYTCGPTVYDNAHIGNFRAFVFYDILKRIFLYFNYDVDHVCNLTDIDDKILAKALQSNKTRCEVTDKYIRQFLKDIKVYFMVFIQRNGI